LVPLGQLTPSDAPIIYGILQPGPDMADGVPYVRPTEIDRGTIKLDEVRRTSPEIAYQYRRATIREGDIILTIVGTIGKVAIVPSELDGGNITQSSCRIRPDTSQVTTAYLLHWLRSPSALRQYNASRLGTAVPRLNIRDIRFFKVPLPSLAEQAHIASLLDAEEGRYLRAMQEAARARALLDRLEAAILARAFRGELVPQDPNDEPATALLARIRAQRITTPNAKRSSRRSKAEQLE
jgi:type I restriction enzyme, S subunit